MSVKRWRQQEEEKGKLEEQEQEILQEFKMNKIKKRVWPDFGGRAFQTNHKTVR